jgi:predicted GNAT family acetyltransferase
MSVPATGSVTDNRAEGRFELVVDGQLAYLLYQRPRGAMTLVHTEVPPKLRGRHVGDRLVEAALQAARREGLRIVAVCPFARAYMRRHPQSPAPPKS